MAKPKLDTRSETRHLVVRYSDAPYGVNTIQEHLKVIANNGAVWLAKFGKPLSEVKIGILNRQIEARIPTFLYLVTRHSGEYQWYRGRLLKVAREIPSSEKQLVPTYYQEEGIAASASSASLWLKLSGLHPVRRGGLGSLHVVSSGQHIFEALHGSMAGMFFVQEGLPSRRRRHVKNIPNDVDHFEDTVLNAFEEEDDIMP
jgi:hypothetical protein